MNKYTLYVGLADKDSKLQEIDTIAAYKLVQRAVVEITGGGSISESYGVYAHADGTLVVEKSLRIEVLYADSAQIAMLTDKLKDLLNQESVLVESTEVKADFR